MSEPVAPGADTGRAGLRVAFVLLGIGDLAGGGGAERFFTDVYARYLAQGRRDRDIAFIADPLSVGHLRRAGCLRADTPVIELQRRAAVPDALGYAVQLLRMAHRGQFDILHVALLSRQFFPCLWLWRCLPRARRPALAVNVVDCTLAHTLAFPASISGTEQRKSYWMHRLLFRTVRCDGIFTWYRALARWLDAHPACGRPQVRTADHCFVDTVRFRPAAAKDPVVVFAARLVPVKQPLLFVEAVRLALQRAPAAFSDWQFRMYGRGVLHAQVRAAIADAQLESRIELGFCPDLAAELSRSRVFVSTQDYENYSSVAMLEALASGNAIIARPVGQTAAFVEHGENGLLAAQDTPAALAEALVQYVTRPQCHERYARRSRTLVEQVHTFDNFSRDLESFWSAVRTRVPAA